MNLHTLIGATHRNFTGVELRHGRFLRRLHPCIFHRRRTHRQQPCRIQFGGHVGQLPLNSLKFRNCLAELLAFFGILQRTFISSLSDSKRERRNGNTPAIENLHGVDKSVALFAQKVFIRNKTIFENHFGSIAGAQAKLIFFLARTKPFRPLLDHKCREPMRPRRTVGYRDHHHHIRIPAVRDERFCSINDVTASCANSCSPCATRIGARGWLGQSPGSNEFARGQFRNVLLLLNFIPCHKYMIRPQRRMCSDNDANGSVHARQLINGGHVFHVAHPGAAILCGENDSQQTELAKFFDGAQRKLAGLVPLHYIGKNFVGGKFAHRLLQMQLFVIELKIQGRSPGEISAESSLRNRKLQFWGMTTYYNTRTQPREHPQVTGSRINTE